MVPRGKSWTMLVATLILLPSIAFIVNAAEPDVLFDIETDEKIARINFIQDDSKIFLHNEERLFMVDGNTGETLWDAEIDDYYDEGLDLIWGERLFITSTKKSMMAYDLSNGELAWESDAKLKMKEYLEYINFDDYFIVIFEDELVSMNPNTGEVHWRQEEFSISDDLVEAGQSTFWELTRDFGDRLLILGDKESYLYNGADGSLMGTYEVRFDNDVVDEPVSFSTDKTLVVFGKKKTFGINISDGSKNWEIEEKVSPKYGYVPFEHEGGNYALLADKKRTLALDLATGETLWEGGENTSAIMYQVEMLDDGTLYAVGFKSKLTIGTTFLAYGFDFATGELKYGPVPLVRSMNGSIFGQVSAALMHVEDVGDDAIYYTFATESRGYDYDPAEKWGADWGASNKLKGGEGFTRINKKTGELIYHTRLKLYENWMKYRPNMVPVTGMMHPGVLVAAGAVIDPILEGNTAYVIAEPGLVKVDLETGETLWTSPEYDHVSDVVVANGKVFGKIGWSRWSFSGQGDKVEGDLKESRDHGFFILNAATGEEIWMTEEKDPMGTFLSHYDPETNACYLCNERYFRRIDIADPGIAWEIDLKKEDIGEIGEDGVAIILTGITYTHGYYYNVTTKEYEYRMSHGAFPLGDGDFLVMAEDAIARIDSDGTIRFLEEWKWRGDKINLAPEITSQGLIYQYKKWLQMISLEDGKVVWKTKEHKAKDVDMFFSSDRTKLFVVGKDEITCYRI